MACVHVLQLGPRAHSLRGSLLMQHQERLCGWCVCIRAAGACARTA